MTSKVTRIFLSLQQAKESGVQEIELFNDWESGTNIRGIKHKINKMLEKDAVKIVDGRWYLCSQYWNMTRAEFQEFSHQSDIMHMQQKHNLTFLGVVCIMSILTVAFSTIGFNLGMPDTIEECGYIFGYDSEIID